MAISMTNDPLAFRHEAAYHIGEGLDYMLGLRFGQTGIDRQADVPAANVVGMRERPCFGMMREDRLPVERQFVDFARQADAAFFHAPLDLLSVDAPRQQHDVLVPA